jgi:replication initiation protein RepC
MAPATLRRHLAALVDVGLIIRRDSPNGKRFARKGQGGAITMAFGFDLSPLVARADKFEAWAEEVRAEERALRFARERITLCRRDITKMIATGLEEGVSVVSAGSARAPRGQGLRDWTDLHALFRGIVNRIPRTADRATLEGLADELALLSDEILNILETHIKTTKTIANESQTERHIQNSNPKNLPELEPAFEESRVAEPAVIVPKPGRVAEASFPLGMVLQACPDINDYAKGGVSCWRDFLAAAAVARAVLGVSPSAWEAAQTAMGERSAAVVVAAILQRGAAIGSAGGYLRELTRKAQANQFSIGPMLMALIGARNRERRRA